MIEWTRFSKFSSDCSNRLGAAVRTMRSQPNWVARLAMFAAAMVILIPIVLVLTLAVIVGVVVFGALAGANVIAMKLRGVMPRNDGRENVRVIRRAEHL